MDSGIGFRDGACRRLEAWLGASRGRRTARVLQSRASCAIFHDLHSSPIVRERAGESALIVRANDPAGACRSVGACQRRIRTAGWFAGAVLVTQPRDETR